MDALEVLREVLRGQMTMAHDMEQTLDELDHEQLHQRLPGSTLQPIAAIYVHSVINEDSFVNRKLRGQATIFENGGWRERLGFEMGDGMQSDEWAAGVRIHDLGLFRDYARQVYASTDDYLASLSEADLDRVIETGAGDMSLGKFLSIVPPHAIFHGGEICALKGCMGGKGLPF
jgi:hypothetical protein